MGIDSLVDDSIFLNSAVGIGNITFQTDEPTRYRQTGAAGVMKCSIQCFTGAPNPALTSVLCAEKAPRTSALSREGTWK